MKQLVVSVHIDHIYYIKHIYSLLQNTGADNNSQDLEIQVTCQYVLSALPSLNYSWVASGKAPSKNGAQSVMWTDIGIMV